MKKILRTSSVFEILRILSISSNWLCFKSYIRTSFSVYFDYKAKYEILLFFKVLLSRAGCEMEIGSDVESNCKNPASAASSDSLPDPCK